MRPDASGFAPRVAAFGSRQRRDDVNSKLRLLTGISVFLALGVAPGCPGDDGTAEGSASGSSGAGDSSTGLGMTSTPTTTPVTTDADSGSGTTSGPTTITATDGSSSDGSTCENAELGASCIDPVCDCASDNCFLVGPLGGVCSECDESADCAETTGFGCNFGNPLTGTPAVCSKTGDVGESCETAADCAKGLFCPTLIEVPGILTAATCSECEPETNDGCTGPDICTPTYDIANIGGNYYCAAPGSVPNDSGCNLTGDGSECDSGQCAPAALMGIPVVAVCSPCNENSDCGGGMTCELPEVAIEGNSLALVPGMCV
jgi:hypothetical protein